MIFSCPVLVSLCLQKPQITILNQQEWNLMWPSADVAHPPWGLMLEDFCPYFAPTLLMSVAMHHTNGHTYCAKYSSFNLMHYCPNFNFTWWRQTSGVTQIIKFTSAVILNNFGMPLAIKSYFCIACFKSDYIHLALLLFFLPYLGWIWSISKGCKANYTMHNHT